VNNCLSDSVEYRPSGVEVVGVAANHDRQDAVDRALLTRDGGIEDPEALRLAFGPNGAETSARMLEKSMTSVPGLADSNTAAMTSATSG
jgi:hypothetical protein